MQLFAFNLCKIVALATTIADRREVLGLEASISYSELLIIVSKLLSA